MSESTAVVEAVAPASSPANKKGAKVAKKPATGKPRVKKVSTHPPVAEMVIAAITALKERGGSSLQAIKKYLAANYKVEPEKLAQFIKKFIKAAVINGTLVQVKGKGASGSFKLAKAAGEKKKTTKKVTTAAKPKAKKPAAAKPKAKSAAPKAVAKKPAAKKKVVAAAAKSVKKAGSVKSPSKQKPTKSSPVKKTKTPKPKKTTAVKKPAAKKAAPKKK
jgi:histone H1/5